MILVLTGLGYIPFDRLVGMADQLAVSARERVLVQVGCSTYEPNHCEFFTSAPSETIDVNVRNARLVVSHDGAGSILTCLMNDTPVVVVPRLVELNECRLSQQSELVEILEEKGIVRIARNFAELLDAVSSAETSVKPNPKNHELTDFIRAILREFENGRA